jgi:hypothetical protein
VKAENHAFSPVPDRQQSFIRAGANQCETKVCIIKVDSLYYTIDAEDGYPEKYLKQKNCAEL